MNEAVTIIGSAIAISGGVPYIINTVRGKTKPNIVTWLTWTLLNGINAIAALSDGAMQTAIFSGAAFTITGSIVAFGFRQGVKRYTKFDATCQAAALLGIGIWLLTKQPALAVLIVLLVDFAGGLPTLRHAFRAPHEETLATFVLSAIGTSLVVASLTSHTFVATAMPLYIFCFDLTLTTVIFTRRKRLTTTLEPAG